MIPRALRLTACLLLAGCSGSFPGEPDSRVTGQAALLASTCSGCHATGRSGAAIASLEGMSAAFLETRLLAYRSEPDGPTAMHRMTRGYTEAQIALIAQYLGDGPSGGDLP